MKLRTVSVVLVVGIMTLICPEHGQSANILFFFGVSTYSHRLIAWPLVEALAEKNHTVTFFQPDTNKNPHPKVIEVNPKMDTVSEQINFMTERLELGHRRLLFKLTYMLPQLGFNFCETWMKDPKVVDWIKNNKFDLIIVDGLFNECAYGIAHLHQAKVIIFGTSHPFGWLADAMGYPSESWWLPEIHFSFDLPLNFMNRVLATMSIFYFNTIRHLKFSQLEEVLRKGLDIPDMPSIPDMMANTSLMLTNTHFSEELARSLPPNVVPIGGMNCKEKSQLKPVPKEFTNFINKPGGEDGFILVSFGSGARISEAPEEVQEIFFKAFEKSKMRFIWKWEHERPKSMPANIMTSKWVPLQELLAHPKIRALIFHGGLLTMHEAICHQVPMVVFPIFAEQDFNGERLQRTGRGITLEITTLTQEQLENAIQKIVHDHRYKKNVIEVSQRFMDRPQKPIETALWWTEYVLRQKDTSFMRPLAAQLTWYQRRLLDVWAFMLTFFLCFSYFILKLAKCIAKTILKGWSTGNTQGKKKVKAH